jgi:hypothetical protein
MKFMSPEVQRPAAKVLRPVLKNKIILLEISGLFEVLSEN